MFTDACLNGKKEGPQSSRKRAFSCSFELSTSLLVKLPRQAEAAQSRGYRRFAHSWVGGPTQDLKRYDAYNAVKHDRESHFEKATLQSTFEAVCACAVMTAAQFGLHDGFGHHSDVASFFRFSAQPTWDLTEMYICPYEEFAAGWSSVTFPFSVQPP
jgi:hypothetical protein